MGKAILDAHGQPLDRRISWKANKKKSLEALLGILNGITADGEVDRSELLLLDVWLKEQEHIKDDPDVVDLIDCVSDILEDGEVTKDELEDAKELINTVLQYRSPSPELVRDAVNHLLGTVQGIVSNRELVDAEIHALRAWLAEIRNGELIDEWPGKVLHHRIEAILADGVVTDQERQDMLETLQALVGDEPGSVGGSTSLPVEELESISFEGSLFCFTGKFAFGPRKKCEQTVIERGGSVNAKVVKSLDYLVLGAAASRDWAHTSFGRKIEKAVGYREEGCGIRIISEDTWTRLL